GFLGPDLTNVAGRALAHLGVEATEEQRRLAFADRFEGTLTTGSERMPAFELSREERVALGAFFVELDRRGVGQASAGKDEAPREILARLLDRQLGTGVEGLSDLEARGRSIVEERGCIDCHLPNARSAFRAPDLTTLLEAAGEERLAEVLRDGIPAKGMPRFGLGMEEARAVTAFLGWLAEHREPLRRGFEAAERGGEGSLAGLPWFEYE
ncbi:MAG TPA: hypothetical protein ENJ09_12380, partial [Planctomycetes bacterium]|nr:hypothetical protein [Planctomycetota bacterium]